jgi:proteasome lid subunit RPN8/RPN11
MRGENITGSEQLEYLEEGDIIISNNAFRKMLQHVFKYANDALEVKQEVLGICLGRKESKQNRFKVNDVIPITHGDVVESGFSQELHNIISEIKRKSLEKELNIIGWYHSHLGYGIYLSNSDRVNHLFFQNEESPYGFAIVFDYKIVESENGKKDYGFEILRFKNYLKGPESGYAKVRYEIEKPNTLDYFKWVKNLVEDSQRKVPIIINEYNEITKPIPEELQKIPSSEESIIQEEVDLINTQMSNILKGSRNGFLKFNDIMSNNIQNEFENWMRDVSKGSLRGIEQLKSSISQMRKTVVDGFEDVENYFTRSFKEISEIFVKDVSGYLNNTIEQQIKLKEKINQNLQNLSSNSLALIKNNIEIVKTEINENISHTEVKIHNIDQGINQVKFIATTLQNNLNDVLKTTDSLTDILKVDINKVCRLFENNLKAEIDGFNVNSDSIIEKNKEIQGLIERLQKVISEFRQLK